MPEYLRNGLTLEIPEGVFPLSTDSVALSDFVRLPGNARVLDLGSGAFTLGLLLLAGNPACTVTGVELDPTAHEAALANIRRNAQQQRLESICADIRQIPGLFPPGSFSVAVSNPPYFSGGPASLRHPTARREDVCPLEELMASAAHALKYGGDLFLVYRPEGLARVIEAGAGAGLEAKRLRLLRHREDGNVALILLQLRKGAKSGLIWEEVSLRHADGSPTPYYRHLYHLEE